MSDKAPIVYDEDGNPLKIRLAGHTCKGDLSGEGHYSYVDDIMPEQTTVTLEPVDDDDSILGGQQVSKGARRDNE